MASIHFKMVNGDLHVLTLPDDAEDQNEVVRVARDDPGRWIKVDDDVVIQRVHVVSMTLVESHVPLVAWG